MAGNPTEYLMWTNGLKILCDMKLDPELAFIKNSFRLLGKNELTLRETIQLLQQINYRVCFSRVPFHIFTDRHKKEKLRKFS
jgi:hypothetical protein